MILRTPAVVLRTQAFSESSIIARFFTREKGKVTVIAKGARRPKSKFGSTLQTLSVVQAMLYHKSTRSIQTLSECAHIIVPRLSSLEHITAGMQVVALTDALTQPEDVQPTLFDLLKSVISALNKPHRSTPLLVLYFEMQLADQLGFAPSFEREAVRTLPADGGVLHYDTGLIDIEPGQSSETQRASREALRMFAILSRARLEVITTWHTTELPEVQHLVRQYLRFHVQDAYPERVQKVLKQLGSAS